MSYPWRPGNQIELLENGEEFFPRVFRRIREAREEVLIQTFILYEDQVGLELRRALIEAAGHGLRVELTVDGFGSPDLSRDFLEGLVEAGVGLHLADYKPRLLGQRINPLRRLHTKIVVIDGRYAFLGGINFCVDHLTASHPKGMQDYGAEIQGPLVRDVRTFALALLPQARPHHWWQGDKDRQPESDEASAAGDMRARFVIRDNRKHKTDIEKQYRHAIRRARHRLVIANAYFFPGLGLLRDIRNAARRGVQVHLILQGRPDIPIVRLGSRMLYAYLMGGGVHIHEYHRRPLHAKVALADSEWATLGSSNLDPSSLALNLESNLFVRSAQFNARLYDRLERLMVDDCHSLSPAQTKRWCFWRGPLIFLIFHFLRRFPAWARLLPAHRMRLATLKPREESVLQASRGEPEERS